MDNIAVLIPCYNEAQTIRKVVTDWKKELPEAVIYVYDNNSTDNTAVIAEEAGAIVIIHIDYCLRKFLLPVCYYFSYRLCFIITWN